MLDRGHQRYTRWEAGSLSPTNPRVNRTAALADVIIYVSPLAPLVVKCHSTRPVNVFFG